MIRRVLMPLVLLPCLSACCDAAVWMPHRAPAAQGCPVVVVVPLPPGPPPQEARDKK